jgi:hypothetical protein
MRGISPTLPCYAIMADGRWFKVVLILNYVINHYAKEAYGGSEV